MCRIAQTVALAFVASIALSLGRAVAQCDDWRAGPLIDIPGMNGRVFATTMWDPDGAGPLPPQLVVGGNFTTASGTVVNCIARWDGSAWQPFGTGMASSEPPGVDVTTLVVLPASFGSMAGQLVAGGLFTSAGGTPANSIARWDGSAWHAFGTGAMYDHPVEAGTVGAMIVAPPGSGALSGHLIAGGFFDSMDGVPCDFVAHWDGTTWASLGTTLGAPYISSMTMWDPDGAGPAPVQVVVGGALHIPASSGADYWVVTWNGTDWIPMIHGFSSGPLVDVVCAVATIPPGNGAFSGQLVAGGVPFLHDFGYPYQSTLYRWDGTDWQSFGDVQGTVLGLGAWDPDGSGPLPSQLIVGGEMTSAGGASISPGIARWDGTTFQSVGAGFDGPVNTVMSWDPDGTGSAAPQLVAGGNFGNAGSAALNSIGHFDGTSWQKFTEAVPGAEVFAITPFGFGLAAAGSFAFTSPSNATPNNIATWDGMTISELGSGTNGIVYALKSFNTGPPSNATFHLVAGGDFTTAGGAPASHIAEWSENANSSFTPPAWSALGNGFNNTVFAIERFNNVIYAGGQFTASTNGGTTLNHIAQWNGTNWVQVGTGLNNICFAMKVYNGQLYAGGAFTTAGGLSSGGLARWNGTSWSIVGGNFVGTVYSLEVDGGDLIIGGAYPGITGNPNIARYNSVSGAYSTLGSGGADSVVRTLLSENGNLYAGGDFTHIGGVAASHFARWNGSAWSDIHGGADNTVYALGAFHNEVHVGGIFSNVRNAAISSHGWARYLETGAPWVARDPLGTSGPCNGEVSFSGRGAAGYSLNYTWRHNGVPLVDGPTGTGSFIAGSHNATIDIVHISSSDEGTYDLVLSNACGSGTSLGATLTISGGTGDGDGNGDGVTNGLDIQGFVSSLVTGVPQGRGLCAYDMNADGVVNAADLPLFVSRLLN